MPLAALRTVALAFFCPFAKQFGMSTDVQQLTGERDRLRLLLEVNNAVVAHLDLRDLLRPSLML